MKLTKKTEAEMMAPYEIYKYPRTPHIEGSRLQPGDEDLSQIPFEAIAGKYLVVEEKCDGANSAISFSVDIDFIEEIDRIIPTFPEKPIDWDVVEKSSRGHFFPDMRKIQQNPEFHGEGDALAHVKLVCEELLEMNAAEEAGCLEGPYVFQDAYTKRAYFSGRNVLPDQTLYDDTWGEVILMSALPGTGKDTWIKEHASGLPVICLDEIRKQMNIKPTEAQGAVVQEAVSRAKVLLRRKQPFVWNATCITKELRQKQIRLFEQYGAGVRIVYLETDRETQMKRNKSRKAEVPEKVIDRMLAKMVPPMPEEAKTVEWICV